MNQAKLEIKFQSSAPLADIKTFHELSSYMLKFYMQSILSATRWEISRDNLLGKCIGLLKIFHSLIPWDTLVKEIENLTKK